MAKIELYKGLLGVRIEANDSNLNQFSVLVGDMVIAANLKREQLRS